MFVCKKCGRINFNQSVCSCGGTIFEKKSVLCISKYRCTYCNSIYETNVISCSNCGGTSFTLIDSDKKIIEGKEYSIDINKTRLLDNNISLLREKYIKFFIIALRAVSIPILILGLVSFDIRKSYIQHFDAFLLCFVFPSLLLIISILVSKYLKTYSSKNKKIEENRKEKWLLFKNMEYDIIPYKNKNSKRYFVRVKYLSPNGIVYTLSSKKIFKNVTDKYVDLLINIYNPEDYFIDFNIEATEI